jgi:phosphoribosylglycinamide formyltransferase-1
MNKKIRIGALISGSGTNLQAIIDGCERGTISGQVVFVGSDNPDAAGLERAKQSRIPILAVDYASIIQSCKKSPRKLAPPPDFNLDEAILKQTFFGPNADAEKAAFFLTTRAIAEAELLSRMAAFDADLLVLAGFMRNLTPYFIDRVNTDRSQPRIMNIHPALLPAFPGVDGYGDTFRYGCKVGGCTVHFIDYGEDTGPIIGQRAFDIADSDTLDSIREKGLKLEWQLYPECIQLYAQGRLKTEKLTYTRGSGRKSERFIVRIEPPRN